MSKLDDDLLNYIRTHFSYCPETGNITRTDRKNSNGSYDKDGYLIIKVKTKQYKAHRIAWFLYHGVFPSNVIDHINRDKSDNRIDNLRDVEYYINVRNCDREVNPNTGVIGVYFDRTKGLRKNYTTKYRNKTYRFYTLEEAIKFRDIKGLVSIKGEQHDNS